MLTDYEKARTTWKHQDINQTHADSLSWSEKFAVWITTKIGTMGTFFLILGWTVFWLSWNTLVPSLAFDPEPAFVIWLIISNMVQLSLLPLIMIGQNLQSRHAEKLAEEIYKLCLKMELKLVEGKE